MLEINVTVNCPDLLAASQVLATAMAASVEADRSLFGHMVANTRSSVPVQPMPQAGPAAPAMSPSIAPTAPTGPSNVVPMTSPASPGYTAAQTTGPMTPPPVAPVQSIPVGQPAQAPINPVPTTTAPGFTQAQIAKAGADLITADPSKRQTLNALLYQYGVQTLSQIPPEHYGAVATALRGMGANI